ncbi:DUF1932 domain-containing protein [Nocardia uniformis]|uniref:DUF1932 domain-containing protein n=1 Tax=Nocardia uniformis TaxID=53432 RepID=A0A849BQU7_9NOCA|nr:NAD(P)-dependent oxidoreductase [Nocardia uniformis]NNH69062.1 DUF1932 domain-containing protein [Nocardia uniformis]
MGSAVAARLVAAGYDVTWCPAGRSTDTRDRADRAGLRPVTDLSALLARADTVISICPAAVAEDVAHTVSEHGYSGVYIDANATKPATMAAIEQRVSDGGASAVVDAVISGSPPTDSTSPRIYLAGPSTPTASAQELLSDSGLDARVLGERVGAASALKMATASYLRSARLLAAIAHGLADAHDVTDALVAEAEMLGADLLADRSALPGVAARGWRWTDELRDIADTLAEAGLPSVLAADSSVLYERFRSAKDQSTIGIDEVLKLIATSPDPGRPPTSA